MRFYTFLNFNYVDHGIWIKDECDSRPTRRCVAAVWAVLVAVAKQVAHERQQTNKQPEKPTTTKYHSYS